MVRKKFLSLGVALCMATSVLLTSALPASAHEVLDLGTEKYSAGHLVYNTDFKEGVGLPWTLVESAPGKADFSIATNAYKIKIINAGKYRWDVQFRHRGINIQSGHNYSIKFTVTADKTSKIYAKVGSQKEMEDGQYHEAWNYKQSWAFVDLPANTPVTVSETFTAKENIPVAEIAFHLGNECGAAGTTFTFKSVSLDDAGFTGYDKPVQPEPRAIRANQLGYYPNGEKTATYVTTASSPQTWVLKDSAGTQVATGQTKVVGLDKDSGDNVHIIDFSSYTKEGKDYKLYVGTDCCYAFDIAKDIYTQAKYDAFKYFYHSRSGIAIEMPYAEKEEWTRKAGHKPDTATGQGFTRDLTGGWYDAGDHGKYVVNGGISLWTLVNQYERSKYITGAAQYKSGQFNIPKSEDSAPDILAEAKWEMDWMMKMQVPSGTYKDMAFHKEHDDSWTGLAVKPADDPKDRIIKPPSTAATLNLAACAAQFARVYKDYNSAYSATCLDSAKRAWKAALANPKVYAAMDDSTGGGAYGDTYVEDDFYWAACELYATTGDAEYLDYIKASKFYEIEPTMLTGGEDMGLDGCFDWGNTSGLGTVTLALVKGDKAAQASIKKAADAFIAIENKQGYGDTITQHETSDPINGGGKVITGYPWGSNSFVVNQAIVMGLASDFSMMDNNSTDQKKYFNGAAMAMDYLVGRNPNEQCYVTGWGSRPLQNPHHRFFSYQCDPTFPKAPAGFLSGGPNSGLVDPWVKGMGWTPGGFPPQKCFTDNIEAWSVNEVTINWNAPLAWVTAYLDDVGPKLGGDVPSDKGDVNGDGKVNVVDATMVKSVVVKKKTSSIFTKPANADMNNDGIVNSIDYLLLKQLIQKQAGA